VSRKKISVGIIGDKRHAKRLREVVDASTDAKLIYIYHPNLVPKHPLGTTNFQDLKKSEAIIIATPNHFHYHYLNKIAGWNKYIFLEKPIAHDKADFHKSVKILNQGKVYVNYNYRKSIIEEKIKEYKDELGDIISIEIVSSNGLAFKKEIQSEWRLSDSVDKDVVCRTKAVHWIDFLSYLFGKASEIRYRRKNFGPTEKVDTAIIEMDWNDGPSAKIVTSYAAPLMFSIKIYGTNGFLSLDNHGIKLASPRDTFQENGLFKEPPEKELKYTSSASLYIDSLQKSFQYFIGFVQKQLPIDPISIQKSIETENLLNEITR